MVVSHLGEQKHSGSVTSGWTEALWQCHIWVNRSTVVVSHLDGQKHCGSVTSG